jgi:hypothetical protein
VSGGFRAEVAMWPMPFIVIFGMIASPFLESEVLELRYEGRLWLE